MKKLSKVVFMCFALYYFVHHFTIKLEFWEWITIQSSPIQLLG